MAFEIFWHPNAIKTLEKLQKDIASRIVKKINEAKEDPKRYAERLVSSEDYKIRVGDYRVFVEISHNPETLAIL